MEPLGETTCDYATGKPTDAVVSYVVVLAATNHKVSPFQHTVALRSVAVCCGVVNVFTTTGTQAFNVLLLPPVVSGRLGGHSTHRVLRVGSMRRYPQLCEGRCLGYPHAA